MNVHNAHLCTVIRVHSAHKLTVIDTNMFTRHTFTFLLDSVRCLCVFMCTYVHLEHECPFRVLMDVPCTDKRLGAHAC